MDPVDNNIKFALSIKDPNVVFYKYNYQVIKAKRAKVYIATVKFDQKHCANCGFCELSHNGHYVSRVTYLPVHLAMDEFRGIGGRLHFICINGAGEHEIQQILPDRFKQSITDYFKQFPASVRARVKTVTVDLNSYYQGRLQI
ncbi:transposase [Latilactobacillus curvatus]|uniref:transposase n=1 Tax=Latilactobacillus curvatus TaxID=28038 RepID=UPI0020C7BDF3|nr:transposase [Latilactobacillus curvatus]MCP8860001.1 transposase [Latilactobacillus curvatus]WRS46215.1 transposase [Latilactobacillus curvatus]